MILKILADQGEIDPCRKRLDGQVLQYSQTGDPLHAEIIGNNKTLITQRLSQEGLQNLFREGRGMVVIPLGIENMGRHDHCHAMTDGPLKGVEIML